MGDMSPPDFHTLLLQQLRDLNHKLDTLATRLERVEEAWRHQDARQNHEIALLQKEIALLKQSNSIAERKNTRGFWAGVVGGATGVLTALGLVIWKVLSGGI